MEMHSVLVEERRFQICEILSRQRTVSAAELKKTLMVTAATIRRDLAALEQQGLLVRSHGGAVSKASSTNFQPSYDALRRSNHEEKLLIAEEAAKLILDGDTVFLEGSSTVYQLATLLLQRNRLTVVTNSPLIVCQLQRSATIKVMCTGGDLQQDIFYLSGLWAQRSLNEIRVDKAVLGVSAIDPAYGISTASQAEAMIKKLIVKVAKERIALADHSKFGNQGFAYVGPSTDIDTLITDSGTPEADISTLRESGIQVIVAGQSKVGQSPSGLDTRKFAGRAHARAK
jgi:DeoR family transcriptional regulator, fructose operon transcriptional repressor